MPAAQAQASTHWQPSRQWILQHTTCSATTSCHRCSADMSVQWGWACSTCASSPQQPQAYCDTQVCSCMAAVVACCWPQMACRTCAQCLPLASWSQSPLPGTATPALMVRATPRPQQRPLNLHAPFLEAASGCPVHRHGITLSSVSCSVRHTSTGQPIWPAIYSPPDIMYTS